MIDIQDLARKVCGYTDPAFMTTAQLRDKSEAEAEYQRRVTDKQKEILLDAGYVVDYLVESGVDMDTATKLYRQLMAKSRESAELVLTRRQSD